MPAYFLKILSRAKAQNLSFPKVPSVNTMLNLNHTLFPTFYGCYEEDVPLVLYVDVLIDRSLPH